MSLEDYIKSQEEKERKGKEGATNIEAQKKIDEPKNDPQQTE